MSSPNPFTGNPRDYPKSSLNPLKGSCLCGSIRVTLHDADLFDGQRRGHLCHCANCRKVAGSYVSSNLIIDKEKVEIEDTAGTLKEYPDGATGSGKIVRRFFCGRCGCPVKSFAEVSGLTIIKMGMFPVIPPPECESFALHKQDWESELDGVTTYKIARGGEKME